MLSETFFGVVAILYYLCFLLLGALTFSIAFMGRRGSERHARLRNTFFLLALWLLSWQATVFLEVRVKIPVEQLWVGRFNFATVAVVVYLVLRFVQQIPVSGPVARSRRSVWLLVETGLLFTITLFSPLVDAAERVVPGQRAVTVFGPLFPIYLLHILVYLALAVEYAFRVRRETQDPMVRRQLDLVGLGLLATCPVAIITNAALPYLYNDFRFCDIGTISTIAFVLAIAYATFIHQLFDVRIIVRETMVYGLLLAFVLGAYSSTVFLVSQSITENSGKFTQFSVLLIAFSVDPLRRFLEKKVDRMLFGPHREKGRARTKRNNRVGRPESRSALALVFPWRRR
jgi:hypothetical protein